MGTESLKENKKLYYLNREFLPGMVFGNLQEIRYEMVVGLDIGHGECMAYVYHKDSRGQWVAEPLTVTPGGDRYIPSYIAYIGDKPVIGSDATGLRGGLQVYFKKEPSRWDTPSEDGVHTYGGLMEDYISVLWATILSKNEVVRECERDKVLIAVGCPASGAWTEPQYMTKYVELTARATGYDNVTILPESTAAIMTPIYSKREVDLLRGVAIYDLGSSTLDFTYILMGKILIAASLPLGGSDIDRAMLRYVAKDNDRDLGDTNAHDLAPAHTKMRLAKERFFNTGEAEQEEESLNVSRELDYLVDSGFLLVLLEEMGVSCDKAGLSGALSALPEEDLNKAMLNLILSAHEMEHIRLSLKTRREIYKKLASARAEFLHSGTPVSQTVTVTQIMEYALDKEMMNSVIWEDRAVSKNKLEAPYAGLSWGECVAKFFERTRDLVHIRSLPCETVILTGGTSKVSAVWDIAEAYYPGKILPEEDPSASVAKGLCLAKGHELGASEQLETLKQELWLETEFHFRQLCDDFAKGALFDRVWDKLIAATKKLDDGENHEFPQLRKKIANYTANNPAFVTDVKEDLRACITESMDPDRWRFANIPHCSRIIRDKANALAREVYNVQATSLPEVPGELITSAARALDEGIISTIIRDTNIALYVQRIAVDFLFSDEQGLLGGLGRMLHQIRVTFNNTLSAVECHDMAMAMQSETTREKYREKMGSKFRDILEKSQAFKDAYRTLIEEQLETAVGIVLFQIFEEYNG